MVTCREEYRLGVFEIWVLRETFGTKKEEVAGEWRKLRNEKLQCLLKGKAIPLQAWTRPEFSRRLRLPDFKTIGT